MYASHFLGKIICRLFDDEIPQVLKKKKWDNDITNISTEIFTIIYKIFEKNSSFHVK